MTVADRSGDVPPGPVHWKVNVVLAERGSVRPLPERDPELDHGPPAVQLVAFVEPHESVDLPPGLTEDGLAESDASTPFGQLEFGGVSALQEPLHSIVPVLNCPQELEEEAHELPVFGTQLGGGTYQHNGLVAPPLTPSQYQW